MAVSKTMNSSEKAINKLTAKINSLFDKIQTAEEKDKPIYFDIKELEKLYIRNKKRKLVNLVLKPAQIDAVHKINQMLTDGIPVRLVCLKARRLGMSTLFCAMVYLLMRDHGYKATLIGQNIRAATTLYKMIKLFHGKDIKWRETPETNNKRELSFSNGGEVWAASSENDDVERGQTNQVVIATEEASWTDPENQMTALLDTVSDEAGTFVIIESTAKGVGTDFHNRWLESESGVDENQNDSIWESIFIPWYLDTEDNFTAFKDEKSKDRLIDTIDKAERELYDKGVLLEQLNWRRHKIASYSGDPEKKLDNFHQEHPSTPEEAFLGSGRPVLNQTVIGEMYREAKVKKDGTGGHPPIFRGDCNQAVGAIWEIIASGGEAAKEQIELGFTEDPQGKIEIWEWPEQHVDYVMGVDISEGIETKDGKTDDSCIEIKRPDTNVYVLRYRGKIPPEALADLISALGYTYNEAFVCPECNNHGNTMLSYLPKIYPEHRIYKSKRGENIAFQDDTERLGFSTTPQTKPVLLDYFAKSVRHRKCKVRSLEDLREMSVARWDKNGRCDTGGKDAFMAIALCEWAQKESRPYNVKPAEKTSYELYLEEKAERQRIIDAQYSRGRIQQDPYETEWAVA